jgi:hypothetical protein
MLCHSLATRGARADALRVLATGATPGKNFLFGEISGARWPRVGVPRSCAVPGICLRRPALCANRHQGAAAAYWLIGTTTVRVKPSRTRICP